MHLYVFLNFVFKSLCSITMHSPWADGAIFTSKTVLKKILLCFCWCDSQTAL